MVPYPVTLGELEQEWEEKLQIKVNDVQKLTGPAFCCKLASRRGFVDTLKLIDIDSSSAIPYGVVLGILLEQRARLLQQLW